MQPVVCSLYPVLYFEAVSCMGTFKENKQSFLHVNEQMIK